MWVTDHESCFEPFSGEIKVSTSTVAVPFSKMALTGQRIAMVDMVFASFACPYLLYDRGGWSQSFPVKIFFSCPLLGDKIHGPAWGQQIGTFWTHVLCGLRWLKSGLRRLRSGLEVVSSRLKVA